MYFSGWRQMDDVVERKLGHYYVVHATLLRDPTRRRGPPSRREATTTHFAPAAAAAPPINCSVLASLCDKNVKIDGAAALGQQLDGRQRGRSLAWSFVAREPARRRLPPPPRRLSRTKETTHWGQNSFSVICALIGRRRGSEFAVHVA